jgi:hypothetical protein
MTVTWQSAAGCREFARDTSALYLAIIRLAHRGRACARVTESGALSEAIMRCPYLLITAIWLSVSITTPAWSDDPRQREDQLKAGYLFNFAKFVEWPASVPQDALTICFLGGAGVQQFLSTDAGSKRIGARGLVVRSLREHDTSNGCNVLYVDSALPSAALSSLNDNSAPILTVSDAKEFTRSGGIIALYTESNRLKFIVNVQNAQRAGLRISSNLLQLATLVEKGDPR